MSVAALREMPLAVAVIHVDGIADIAQIIATKLSEQIMSAAIRAAADITPTTRARSDPGGTWDS